MPFDGSGTFQRVMNWVNDAAANVKIRADRHDQEDDNFAAGLSNVITKDGQTLPTANIPWNNKRLVNVADPVNPQDAATINWINNNVVGGSLIADAPPAAGKVGNLWWESDTGNLYLRYDDGSSVQWVQVNVAPPFDPTKMTGINGRPLQQRDLVQEVTVSSNQLNVDFDFPTGWPADYDNFELDIDNLTLAANAYLFMRVKTGNPPVVAGGASAYGWGFTLTGYGGSAGGEGSITAGSSAGFIGLSRVSNTSYFLLSGAAYRGLHGWRMQFQNPTKQGAVSGYTPFLWNGFGYEAGTSLIRMSGVGTYAAITPITGLQFGLGNAVNISGGRWRLWGLRS
jgi:hypothetical protein